MKQKIISFGRWAEKNWLALVILMVCIMLGFLCVVMASWFIGFWANALYGTKFDLGSCWQGISVVVAGLGGIAALAKAAWTKYSIDSQFNTPRGFGPQPDAPAMKGGDPNAEQEKGRMR